MFLGGVAAKTVPGVKTTGESRGKVIEKDGRKYIVGYHPAARFYRGDPGEKVREDFALLRQEAENL